MKIVPARVDLPPTLRTALALPRPVSSGVPGLIVDAEALLAQRPAFRRVLDAMDPSRSTRPGFIVVKPDDVPLLFRHDKELGLLKAVLKTVAGDSAPYVVHGIDAAWLVYGAFKFKAALEKPDRDAAACFWEFAGLATGAATLACHVVPSLEMPDSFANGLNYLVKSGSAISAGKAVPVNEMALSKDARNAIPLAVLKMAGLSLDGGAPSAARPTLVPLRPAR